MLVNRISKIMAQIRKLCLLKLVVALSLLGMPNMALAKAHSNKTLIPVKFSQTTELENTKVGDTLVLKVTEDVNDQDGRLLFKRGTVANAQVTKVSGKALFGGAGSLKVSAFEISDVYGTKHQLELKEHLDKRSLQVVQGIGAAATGTTTVAAGYAASTMFFAEYDAISTAILATPLILIAGAAGILTYKLVKPSSHKLEIPSYKEFHLKYIVS